MSKAFVFVFSISLFFIAVVTANAESNDQKFVVGLILPLSGELADYGEALRHGFELAQEQEPELFKHLELRYQDSQYDQKTALSAFNKLELQGDVNLYHTWGVSPNETILPLANMRGRPVLAETSMRKAAVNRPFVVRAARTGYDAAEKLVQVFAKKNWKHVGILVSQIPYYMDIVDALKECSAKYGVHIDVIGDVTPTEQDFRTMLLKIKSKNYDAFGPLLLLNQLLTFCEQANLIQFEKPMFGAHIHNSSDAMRRCLPLSDGALFPGQVVSKDFHDRYDSRYHTDLRLDSAAHSYETARIIAELFGNDKSYKYTPQEILNQLKTVRRSVSSVGSYQYSETPAGGKSISFNEVILTFKNDQIAPFN